MGEDQRLKVVYTRLLEALKKKSPRSIRQLFAVMRRKREHFSDQEIRTEFWGLMDLQKIHFTDEMRIGLGKR